MALIHILAKLGIDSTGYNAGLKKAESAAQAAGRVMRSHLAQAFTVAAIGKLTHSITTLAGKIKDSADQFSLSRTEAQELMRVASDAGVSFEQLGQAVNKITAARAAAAAGNEKEAEAFAKLGINLERVVNGGVRSYDILRDIGRTLEANGNNLLVQGAAFEILGVRSAPLFAAIKGIHAMGPMVILTDEEIDKIDKAGKTISHMKEDMLAFAASRFSDIIEDAGERSKRPGPYKITAGLDAVIMGYIKTAMYGFTPEGNEDMGRLDLKAGLERRDAIRKEGEELKRMEDEKRAEAEAKLADKLAKVASVKAFSPSVSTSTQSDPLAKIGGLYMGADAGMRNVPQRQLEQLRELNQRVSRIEQAATAQ